MYVGVSPARMSVHQVPAWCPQRAEDSMRSPVQECFLDPGDVCPSAHADKRLGVSPRTDAFMSETLVFKALIHPLKQTYNGF